MNVAQYYKQQYPTDELGKEINKEIHFDDILIAINKGKDIYELINVGDSIVRERIFEKLAEISLIEYDVLYRRWLGI
jgi:hypothetical protein